MNGFFTLDFGDVPIMKEEDLHDEEMYYEGPMYLWNKTCWVRGCDESVLKMFEAHESHPLFVGKGLSVADIRRRYQKDYGT